VLFRSGNPEGSSQQDAPLTPGVLGSGPSYAVSVHHGLLRPHPSVSQARGDFTGLPLIHPAFAVRERRGDPRDVPSFPGCAVPACRGPYAGGLAAPSRCPGAGDDRLPHVRTESPPPCPPLPAIPGGCRSRRCILRFMLRPAGLPRPPGWLQRGELTASPCLLRTLSPSLLSACLAARG